MNEEPYLPPREPGEGPAGTASSCLWTLWIWFGPTLVVPFIFLFTAAVLPLGVVLSIGFLIFMGSFSVGRKMGKEGTRAEAWRVLLYVVLQIVWIPLFSFAVLWGICAMNGGMKI